MDHTSLDFGEPPDGLDPPIGIYSCLLCELHYSMKAQLNQHYRETHRGSLPEYRGNRRQPILNRIAEGDEVERSLAWVYSLPSSTIQLIALLILVLIYYNIQ